MNNLTTSNTEIATVDWTNFFQAGSNWMADAEILENKEEWSISDYLLIGFRSLAVLSYGLKTADSTKALFNPKNQ